MPDTKEQQRVLAVYPRALAIRERVGYTGTDYFVIYDSDIEQNEIGMGATESQAWSNAAANLPKAEPEGGERKCSDCDLVNGKPICTMNCGPRVPQKESHAGDETVGKGASRRNQSTGRSAGGGILQTRRQAGSAKPVERAAEVSAEHKQGEFTAKVIGTPEPGEAHASHARLTLIPSEEVLAAAFDAYETLPKDILCGELARGYVAQTALQAQPVPAAVQGVELPPRPDIWEVSMSEADPSVFLAAERAIEVVHDALCCCGEGPERCRTDGITATCLQAATALANDGAWSERYEDGWIAVKRQSSSDALIASLKEALADRNAEVARHAKLLKLAEANFDRMLDASTVFEKRAIAAEAMLETTCAQLEAMTAARNASQEEVRDRLASLGYTLEPQVGGEMKLVKL